MRFFYLFICFCFFETACSSFSENQAWDIASRCKSNQRELIRFLEYYKQSGDKEKYQAACFLIENMPGKYSVYGNYQKIIYDIDVVIADSLIQSLEYSFRLWKQSPYLKNCSFEDFCEYILPYRIATEPLVYYWKWDCKKRFGHSLKSPLSIAEAAQIVNKRIYVPIVSENQKGYLKSYSEMISGSNGTCDDRAILTVMALRSIGIPAAFDYIPYWGSSNNGHSFCSVISGNQPLLVFQDAIDSGQDYYFARKTPKVFRKTYKNQNLPNKSGRKLKNIQEELPLFSSCIDVTAQHKIGIRDVKLAGLPESCHAIYLSVFSPNGWLAVDRTFVQSGEAIFESAGTGIRKNGKQHGEAKSLGDGIVYLPSVYRREKMVAVANPIIVSESGVQEIVADTSNCETVILTRKYPLSFRVANFANNMIGGIFEGANRVDFSDAIPLYQIDRAPASRVQTASIRSSNTFRYIRYRRPRGVFSIAEMTVLDENGNPLHATPIVCRALTKVEEYEKIFDGDPLSYYDLGGGFDIWVGLDLGIARKVGYINFAPRNDDNCIRPGDRYELLCFIDGDWQSLGEKIATEYQITYDHVPRNGLLWLRNLSRGREERPFIYQDGCQKWW